MRGLLLAGLLSMFAARAGAAAAYLPPPGTGVAVRLANDREIAGTFLGERDGAVWIGVDGGEVGVEPADIVLVRAQPSDDTEYRRRASRLGRDAAGWWALAQWARDRGLRGCAEDAARRVVELSPEHAGARALLGEEKVGGAWLSRDAAMEAKGFVEHRGSWVLREEHERLERARREARHEERLDAYLRLERSRLAAYSAPPPAPAAYYPPPWWWWRLGGDVPEQDTRGLGRYAVPWRPREPFAPSFHEGYFQRGGR